MVSINEYTKLYFSKLINSYINSIDNIIRITKAFSLAIKAHENQLYKFNKQEPYINHPLRVCLILIDELGIIDIDIICTALLHDALEKNADSKLNGMIKKEFGNIIYDNVRVLTKPKKIKEDKNRDLIQEYFKTIQNSPSAIRYIKLADRLDNIRLLKNNSKRDKISRYKEETQRYVIPIAERTDERILLKLTIGLYELK